MPAPNFKHARCYEKTNPKVLHQNPLVYYGIYGLGCEIESHASCLHHHMPRVSTRKSLSVVPWAPFSSAVMNDTVNVAPPENIVSS